MSALFIYPCIRSIELINSSIMFVHLDNDRTFIVTLDKFPEINERIRKEISFSIND